MHNQELEDEIWKLVFCSKNYMISNKGRVKSLPRKWVPKEKILTTHLVKGYPSINVDGINKRIHKLICEAFIGSADGLFVNHINGIKTDNRLCNLEYVTHKENNQHAFRTGLINNSGENHGMAKLSNVQATVIKEAVNKGYRGMDVARYFKVSKATVSMIKHSNRFILLP